MRGGVYLSIIPNSTDLNPSFAQFQWVGEIERRYDIWEQPGKLAVTGFLTRGRMGTFADAIALAAVTGGPADIAVRRYNSRGGVSLTLEQQLTEDLGLFARAGWANGGHGDALFVVTRQQLVDIARECARTAEGMPKPL